MRRRRFAKIVATIGPATESEDRIADLFKAGVDVFRLNFSHATHEEQKLRIEAIRRVEKRFDSNIAILADLQGPKLRVGVFADREVRLHAGAKFRLDLSDVPGDENRVPLPHPEIFAALEPDTDLLLDDGKVRLRVESCGPDFAETRVITGGKISNHKGVNVPQAIMNVSPLTPKDRADLDFALANNVDWIALSFVQRPEDLIEARRLIQDKCGILAKLEKPSAIDSLEKIVDLSDAIMVARGDLGVEIPAEDVPPLQKAIIRACRRTGTPVVVATQMLDSMVKAPTPTRAEASDVATAVYDGVDAVMLSAESAVGDYPVESVQMMDRIIRRVERDPLYSGIMRADTYTGGSATADAITAAARQSANAMQAAAIVTFTASGSTTLRAARERPEVPILSLTPDKRIARKLAIAWGAHGIETREVKNSTDMVEVALDVTAREGFAKPGDRLVVTGGVPFGVSGTTNTLRVATVGYSQTTKNDR